MRNILEEEKSSGEGPAVRCLSLTTQLAQGAAEKIVEWVQKLDAAYADFQDECGLNKN
jgi:hypothetical protein